jgi:hypothetical protein
MIVLSAFALLIALVAVTYFAGQSSARPSEPSKPRDPADPLDPTSPLGMLNPANPLSPLWAQPADSTSDQSHESDPHASSHMPHASGEADPTPHASNVDTGSFDAGSHHGH